MASNSLGKLFRISSYGESHGAEVGVLVDGCPAGIEIDRDFMQSELNRRRPGQSDITTQRNESDQFEIASGVFENKTTGAPILIRIPNKDQRSRDYSELQDLYRPSHADQTYDLKYGIRDHRGGGRASARITAGWVAAGALAKLVLKEMGSPEIHAYVRQIHEICDETPLGSVSWEAVESNIVRMPDATLAQRAIALIEKSREEGDSLGGVIRGCIMDPASGLGEPLFDKFQARLGRAILSLNAVKGISFGEGFDLAGMNGSESNESWSDSSDQKPATNRGGGLAGGITNGNPVYFDVAFKPTASISRDQKMLNKEGEVVSHKISGRHDPCVVPRAVPIVESLTALVYLDFILLDRAGKI